ncbi:MAG: TraR/DksA C4-type zinc finger protein [Candidatus Komeilibacteria bacterium]|nr:TraR/DksA C4-type zinc finger protein [Candidatus Komeilibacteria bacterium]
MDTQKLEQFKKLLVEEKTRLEEELKQFAKPNPRAEDDYNAQFPERGDKEDENAAEIADYTVNLPLERALEKQLQDVDVAIKRIDEGNYGLCKYCHQPIEEKRLEARPTSSACISCKKQLTQEV